MFSLPASAARSAWLSTMAAQPGHPLCRKRARLRQAELSLAARQQAASARDRVSTWTKPQPQPSPDGPAVELLGLVLTHMVAASSMWEYPVVVRELCGFSLVSKNMYLAVQQHAWPKLLDMPGPKKPYFLISAEQRVDQQVFDKCKLPAPLSLDDLVSASATTTVAVLKELCKALRLDDAGKYQILLPMHSAPCKIASTHAGCISMQHHMQHHKSGLLPHAARGLSTIRSMHSSDLSAAALHAAPSLATACAGAKPQLMVRLLEHFGLSHPCSAPLQVVAQHQAHAAVILNTVQELGWHHTHPHCHGWHPLCQHLVDRLHTRLGSHKEAVLGALWSGEFQAPMSGPARAYANRLVCEAMPQLQTMYGGLHELHLQIQG